MFVWTAQLLFESNLPVPEWGAGRFGISAQFDQVVVDFPAMPRRWTCGYVRPEAKGLTDAILEEPIVSLNQAPK